MKQGKYFKMAQTSDQKAEIFIYGDIVSENWRWSEDETSAVSFRDALAALGDVEEIDLRINSGGGDVFEATAIYNMIKRHKAAVTAHIDGLAASAASVIAMAADRVVMPANAMLMIHNAWSIFMGDHIAMKKFAEDLEKINESVKRSYLDKNEELDANELTALMDAETWLSADEALEMGLADEVIAAVQVAASITKDQLARYENAPSTLKKDVEEQKSAATVNVKIDSSELAEIFADMQKQIDEIKNQKPEKEPQQTPAKQSGLQKFFLNSK